VNFRVGQEVECIDGTPNPDGFSTFYPVKGLVYTIRAIHIEPHIADCGILLEEIVNPLTQWADAPACEWPFASRRFRPIVSRKTDISTPEALLTPSDPKTREDA
jgi:hypothetical protein